MNGFVKKTLAAWVVSGFAAMSGCVHEGFRDPCYPERYSAIARQEVRAAFAPQVNNGHVLDQTVWNTDFEPRSDTLTAGGKEHLAYLARRRPTPDPVVYLQTAQDVPAVYEPAAPDKYMMARNQLDSQRAVAAQKYLVAISAPRAIPWEVKVHDPPTVGANGEQTDIMMQMYDKTVFTTMQNGNGATAGSSGH